MLFLDATIVELLPRGEESGVEGLGRFHGMLSRQGSVGMLDAWHVRDAVPGPGTR